MHPTITTKEGEEEEERELDTLADTAGVQNDSTFASLQML